ncbi:MAG: hypothetical protein QXW98_05125 [Candidatus Caldarchaeum sp.]
MFRSYRDHGYVSRKFVLTLLAMISSFYLVLIGKSIGEYTTALGVILGFYQSANVAEKYIESKKKGE